MKAKLFIVRAKTFAVTLLIVGGAVVSCTEKDDPSVAPSEKMASQEKVEKLLDRAYQNGTSQSYEAITAEFKQLSPAEFELFNKLKTERDIKKLDLLQESSGRIDLQEKESIIRNIRAAQLYRQQINAHSLNEFGKTINQLSNQEFSRLDQSFRKSSRFDHTLKQFGLAPAEPSGRTMACSLLNFPFLTTRTNNTGNTWTALNNVINEPNESPCDYEFTFTGTKSKIHPDDWFAEQLLNSYGGNVNYRLPSNATKVITGWSWTTFWEGDARLTSISMLP